MELLTKTFKWEIATVLACAGTGANPFEWPEVRQPRTSWPWNFWKGSLPTQMH